MLKSQIVHTRTNDKEILDFEIFCTFKCYWTQLMLGALPLPQCLQQKQNTLKWVLMFMPCLFMDTRKGLTMPGMTVGLTNIPRCFFYFSIKVRDEYREDYDAGRGGYGKLAQKQWVVRAPVHSSLCWWTLPKVWAVSLLHWKPLLVFLWTIKDRIQKNAFNSSLIRLIFLLLGQTRNPGQQTQSVPIKLSAGYHTSFRETGKCQIWLYK